MAKKTQTHVEQADEKKLKLINFISFLFGFAGALLSYVLSDYFRLALKSDNVSVFYFIAYVVVLIGLLNLHKLVNKLGKYLVFFLLFFLQICFVVFLIFVHSARSSSNLEPDIFMHFFRVFDDFKRRRY